MVRPTHCGDVGTLFVRRKLSAPATRKETVVGTTQERRHLPGHSRDNADWEDRSRGAGQPETREVMGFPATYVRRKTPCSAKGICWHQTKKKQNGTCYETKQPEENKWMGVLGNLTLRE